jgi:hypothetical protein
MTMKFTIEQRHLTDQAGKPVTDDPGAVSFHTCEAENVDDAVRLFVSKSRGEVIGNVIKFPGFHAVATVREVNGVYTLQVSPSSSQNIVPRRE